MSNHESNMHIVSEKLTEDNFHAWKFRITNYLKGKGYWDYVEGANEAPLVIPDTGASIEQVKSLKDWYQGSTKVMYWLSLSISDSIVGHIEDANSPKDAWDNLIAFNATNTRARKIQLKNELNTIKKGNLLVNNYTLKIKALCESLSSTGVTVDDDDKVEACLCDLGNVYKQFKTSIRTWKNIPHFLELSLLLVVEEKSLIDDGVIQTGRKSANRPFMQVQEEVEDVMHKGVAVTSKARSLPLPPHTTARARERTFPSSVSACFHNHALGSTVGTRFEPGVRFGSLERRSKGGWGT
ncbi:hypothetical protein L7F22_000419 [Adiantum nelumboides]|nr:hypothetical protein [Adiantum nelumboides]